MIINIENKSMWFRRSDVLNEICNNNSFTMIYFYDSEVSIIIDKIDYSIGKYFKNTRYIPNLEEDLDLYFEDEEIETQFKLSY